MDYFLQLLQDSMSVHEQTVSGQSTVIERLTAKVETSEEQMSLVTEQLEQHRAECETLKDLVRKLERDVVEREEELQQTAIRHQREIQRLVSTGDVNIQVCRTM